MRFSRSAIAGALRGGRVTMRTMVRALCLVALLFVACGDDTPAPASSEEVEAARAETAEIAELAEQLEQRVAELQAEIDHASTREEDLGTELERAVEKLTGSIDKLKSSLGRTRDSTSEAAAAAASAAAQIGEAVRRLTIIENRYDFHLRRYHGGG